MKIGFTDNPDTYKFSNRFNFELIFFKAGVIVSKTPKKPTLVDFYEVSSDTIIKKQGHKRVSKFYKLKNKYPFIELDSSFSQTIPII